MDGKVYDINAAREIYDKSNHYVHYLLDFYDQFIKNSCFPAGHYHSPIADLDEVREYEAELFDVSDKAVAGIDLNEEHQIELLRQFESYIDDMPFPMDKEAAFRYYLSNEVFSYTDGIMLYSFLRHFKPGRVIEIGSGFSSALMLDINKHFFDNSINLTFIEPGPERLFSLIKEEDKQNSEIIVSKVQDIEVSFFQKLEENDILFVDGSHVSKTGSDLNYLLFEVVPTLKKGVIVHFHDIFCKFQYPKDWVFEGRNWNECYLLRSFLMFNDRFSILMFNNYLKQYHVEKFGKFKNAGNDNCGSLWVQRVKL